MDFVELPDGTLINTAAILRIQPPSAANRVDYLNGFHHTLASEYAEVLRDALRKPKPKRRDSQKPEVLSKK